MNLAEYRRTATRLADYLPWAALVGSGVVLNKDGSFQRTAKFRGPDLDSAVAAELVAVAGRINNAVRRLGSGWSIFVEAQRSEAATYPDSTFPDPASALVDAERKASFEEADAHFVSGYFLTFLWLPPAEEAARAETWLYEGREKTGVDPWELLRGFIDRTDRVLALLDGFMPECRWMDDGATLTYLHSTISTNRHRVRVPEVPMHLDALLADQPLTGGLEPRLGDAHLRVLTIVGFPMPSVRPVSRKRARISCPATSSPSSGCPRPRKPPALRHGSTRAGRKRGWTRGKSCAASSTAPTACWPCLTASCPSAVGWMTARR